MSVDEQMQVLLVCMYVCIDRINLYIFSICICTSNPSLFPLNSTLGERSTFLDWINEVQHHVKRDSTLISSKLPSKLV